MNCFTARAETIRRPACSNTLADGSCHRASTRRTVPRGRRRCVPRTWLIATRTPCSPSSRRTVQDRGRAEDLAQDVFLRVHQGLPHFRGKPGCRHGFTASSPTSASSSRPGCGRCRSMTTGRASSRAAADRQFGDPRTARPAGKADRAGCRGELPAAGRRALPGRGRSTRNWPMRCSFRWARSRRSSTRAKQQLRRLAREPSFSPRTLELTNTNHEPRTIRAS